MNDDHSRADMAASAWPRLLEAEGPRRLEIWAEAIAGVESRLAVFIHYRMTPALRRRMGVEDVLQQVLLVSLEKLDDFRRAEADAPFRWLIAIAYRVLANLKRREAIRLVERSRHDLESPHFAESPSANSELVTSATRASERAMPSEETARMLKALESMQEADRGILLLRHFEDLSHQEIADRLGISAAAARQRYTRASERLRLLAGDAGNAEHGGL